jgi:predicted short-subunit dehydrogenase-like oxidoreductase (DUF2520 family)
MTLSVSIIGAGRLGGALAIALARENYSIKQLVSHQRDVSEIKNLISPATEILSSDELEKLSADIIFIAVPDSKIQATAKNLSTKLQKTCFAFHTSGVLSSDVLEPLKKIGCQIGSLHPLVSISEAAAGAKNFKDVFFCVEGDESAAKVAQNIVADLQGKSFAVPTEFKSLYHASAVMASGHLTALFSLAIEMLAKCGLSETDAQKTLLPLVESTVKNLSSQNPARALTGPFARADVETIRLHLETLRQNAAPETMEIYRLLGVRSLQLAEKQNADEQNLERIRQLLLNDKQ